MALEAKKIAVLSIDNLNNFVSNAEFIPTADETQKNNKPTTTMEYEGKEISLDSAAAVLLQGDKKRYNRLRDSKRDFMESQVDMFAQQDAQSLFDKDSKGLDELEATPSIVESNNDNNPFGVFSKIDSTKVSDKVRLTFVDEEKTFGTESFTIDLPIVDDNKTLVAMTVDDVKPTSEISDEQFDKAFLEVSKVMETTIDAITRETKPTYSVYALPEFEMTEFLDEVAEEYGEKNVKYAESNFEEGKEFITFKFSDKLMKDVDSRYSNQHDSEFPNKDVPKYGVKMLTSDVSYNGVSDENPTVIIREPWMIKNTFNASMHANLIDVIEDKLEINELHTKVERGDIKHPERPLTEELKKKETMGLSL